MPRSILSVAMLAMLSAGACHGGAAPSAVEIAAGHGREPLASSSEVDPRDQYALAQAIAQARASTQQLETALARTRSAWIGRRYRWELAFMPALCGETGPCVMMPFDHRRDPEHPIRQGWLPRLELPDAERRALADACGGHARCVVDVSGQLGQLELSTEQPTSLTLSQVELHGAREAGASESWVLGTRRPVVSRRSTVPRAG
jgi:hypothetical protein